MSEVNLNRRNENGDTLLHIAARNNRLDIMITLLNQEGIRVNARNNDGEIPLHIACRESSPELIELLLHCDRSSILIRDYEGHTSIHTAAQNKSFPDAMHFILNSDIFYEHGISINCVTTALEFTPLHIACKENNFEAAKQLLNKGAEIDCLDADGKTPLVWACQEGLLNIANLLLEWDCGLSSRDINNQTAFHIATLNSKLDIMQLLLRYDRNLLNLVDSNEDSALHMSIKCDYTITNYLIQEHALMDLQNDKGDTPLHLASAAGDLNVVRLFLQHDESIINIKNNEDKTAFHLACEHGCVDVVSHFLNIPQNTIEETYLNGKNSLHLASEYGKLTVLAVIIEERELNTVQLQCRDDSEMTPLHLAALYGHTNIVRFLLSKGVNADLIDVNGNTALHLACVKGYVEIVHSLINYGIKISGQNNNGKTAFDIATKRGHYDIVNKLLHKFHLNESLLYLPSTAGYKHVFERLVTAQPDILDNVLIKIFDTATEKGRLDVIGYLSNFRTINAVDSEMNEKTPLHIAAEMGNYLTCHLLLEKYGDTFINQQDENGNTALHLSLLSRSLDITEKLFYHGASNEIQNDENLDAVELGRRLNSPMTWL